MFHRFVYVLAILAMVLPGSRRAKAENGTAVTASQRGVYDADPAHLWNRLHRALFLRTAPDGIEYGLDQLDPPLWVRTKYLLEGPSHQNAIKVLDEFLANHGERLIQDPLKRAFLQRDLWAVFDWTAHWFGAESPIRNAPPDLQLRLASVIRRLALTKKQIGALPDNYTDAVKSGKFESDYNENKPTFPFLPRDLFSTNGPWVCVGLGWEQQIAPIHVSQFGGRSAFLVFMRTPGGRQEATNYLMQLREFRPRYTYKTNENVGNQAEAVLNPNRPQFPNGTSFVLVRQMILVDQNGDLIPTHLTESAQIRHYSDVQPKRGADGRIPPDSQSMFEFVLNRKQLFDGHFGGLRTVVPGEIAFRQFMSQGFDPFEETGRKLERSHPALDCRECHEGSGVYSVNSFRQVFEASPTDSPQIKAIDPQQQRDAARIWKERQYSWGLLQGLGDRN